MRDDVQAVQKELERQAMEPRDSLGVNDEVAEAGGPIPVGQPFITDARHDDGDGCTDTALCSDLEWGPSDLDDVEVSDPLIGE